MKRILSLFSLLIISALLLSACGVEVNLSGKDDDDGNESATTTEPAPDTSGDVDTAPPADVSGADPAPSPAPDPAPTSGGKYAYEGKYATDLFRDEVLPRFVDPEMLKKDSDGYSDLSWHCDEEDYTPLKVKSSNYKYHCSVDYLGRATGQSFILTFKTDGTFATSAAGPSKKHEY